MLPGQAGFAGGRVADDQRADAVEPAVLADQRRAAPVRRRRRREDRLVEQVLPVRRERGAWTRRTRSVASSAPPPLTIIIGSRSASLAESPSGIGRDVERHDGSHQAEAGRVVVGDHPRRQRAAAGVDDADLVGLDDQVADGEDQPVVADDDAAAFALGAERGAAARVGHGAGLHLDDRGEERVGVESRRRRGCLWRRSGGRRRGPSAAPAPAAASSAANAAPIARRRQASIGASAASRSAAGDVDRRGVIATSGQTATGARAGPRNRAAGARRALPGSAAPARRL